MSIRTKIAKISAVAALGVGATVLGSGAALAGTNGQQAMFQDDLHVANSVEISGYNQNGDWVDTCVNTPGYQTWISGYWWVKDVVMVGYRGSDCTQGATTINIITWFPVSQNGDWVTVSDYGYQP